MSYSQLRLASPRRGLLLLVVLVAGLCGCVEEEQPAERMPVDDLVVRWEAARAHSIDPGPSGTLFVQRPDGVYRSVPVEGGICAIKLADAGGLDWRGGVIGVHSGVGANQVAVEVRPQGQQLMLKLVHAFWIEVVSAETGELLAAVELLRHREPGTGPEQKPPAEGEERAEDRLYLGPENPVLVLKSELLSSARTVWVRAAGYGWTAVRLHADSAALQRVELRVE